MCIAYPMACKRYMEQLLYLLHKIYLPFRKGAGEMLSQTHSNLPIGAVAIADVPRS